MSRLIHVRGGLVLSPGAAASVERDLVLKDGVIADLLTPGQSIEAAEVVDAADRLVTPGFVNAHTHGQLNLSKGANDRWNLEQLLNAFPWIGSRRNPEIHYVSALLGAADMVRKGCTTAFDLFSEFPAPTPEGVGAVAQAYSDLGMRAVLAPMMADRSFYQAIPGLIDAMPADLREEAEGIRFAPYEKSIERCRTILETWSFDRNKLKPALAPTIPHHCSDDFLKACGRLAEEHGAGMQMHVAESRMQAVVAAASPSVTAVSHLDALGLLRPGFVAAHAVWITDDDARRLADCGCSIAHNPGSNLRLGSGLAPVRRYLDAGVNIAIGTDGAITSDSLNMVEAVRLAALVSRMHDLDVDRWLSASEVWHAGTVGGARALGFGDEIGAIAKGRRADLVFFDLSYGPFVPLGNAVNQLVYGEDGTAIKAVMIDGRMIYDGRFLTIDYPGLVTRARAMAADLAEATLGIKAKVDQFEPLVRHYCAGLAARPLPVERLCCHQA